MAVGVLEVYAAAAVVLADFARASSVGIGPVLEALITDAREDLVELFFANQEGVVLGGNLTVVIVEVDRNVIVEWHDKHRSEGCSAWQAEDFSEKGCRLLLFAAPNDRVI